MKNFIDEGNWISHTQLRFLLILHIYLVNLEFNNAVEIRQYFTHLRKRKSNS